MSDAALKRAQSLVGTSEGRPDGDFYPTPASGTRALMENESFEGLVWEPACGTGDMSEVIKQYDLEVISTDIEDRGYWDQMAVMDFMDADPEMKADNIIMNPPFSVEVDGKKKGCEVFVQKALAHTTRKVAVLQKLAFLEGTKRQEMFESTPLKVVYVFSKRLSMTREGKKMKNSGMIPFAWYVWEHGYEGDPIIKWVNHSVYEK